MIGDSTLHILPSLLGMPGHLLDSFHRAFCLSITLRAVGRGKSMGYAILSGPTPNFLVGSLEFGASVRGDMVRWARVESAVHVQGLYDLGGLGPSQDKTGHVPTKSVANRQELLLLSCLGCPLTYICDDPVKGLKGRDSGGEPLFLLDWLLGLKSRQVEHPSTWDLICCRMPGQI